MLLRLARPRPIPMIAPSWSTSCGSTCRRTARSGTRSRGCLPVIAWSTALPDTGRYGVTGTRTSRRRDHGHRRSQREFERVFVQSVDRRFDSTGPVLAHLSGGVDSSSIMCIAERMRRESPSRPALTAVSQRFPGQSWDEGPFIAAVRESTASMRWTGTEARRSSGSDRSVARGSRNAGIQNQRQRR